jgi:hypothetical protein
MFLISILYIARTLSQPVCGASIRLDRDNIRLVSLTTSWLKKVILIPLHLEAQD